MSEASGSTGSFGQLPYLLEHDTVNPRHHHLGYAVSMADWKWLLSEIYQDDFDLAAIIRIDRRRRIGQRDHVLQCQAAPRAKLSLISFRQLDGEPRRDEGCRKRLDRDLRIETCRDIHAGGMRGSIGRQNGILV